MVDGRIFGRRPGMARKERAVDSVAEAYLTLLAERWVEYLFANSGTDFAPAQMSHGRTTPGGPRARLRRGRVWIPAEAITEEQCDAAKGGPPTSDVLNRHNFPGC
jgi:hypothetical protein